MYVEPAEYSAKIGIWTTNIHLYDYLLSWAEVILEKNIYHVHVDQAYLYKLEIMRRNKTATEDR